MYHDINKLFFSMTSSKMYTEDFLFFLISLRIFQELLNNQFLSTINFFLLTANTNATDLTYLLIYIHLLLPPYNFYKPKNSSYWYSYPEIIIFITRKAKICTYNRPSQLLI